MHIQFVNLLSNLFKKRKWEHKTLRKGSIEQHYYLSFRVRLFTSSKYFTNIFHVDLVQMKWVND